MFTLNTRLIPALNRNGISFRYIGGLYDPMTIIITHKHFDICRVDMNRDVSEGHNYDVYWFPTNVKNACRLRKQYLITQDFIDDIRRAIDFNFEGENKMNKKMYKVTDVVFKSSTGQIGEMAFNVNILRSSCATQEDCDRIRDAIENISDTNASSKYNYNYRGGFTTWRNEYQKERDKFDIKDVIFNNPATIVFWGDGTKTVVKAENEEFDPEKGLAMAIAKKALGNNYGYYDVFKKYVGKYEKKQKKGN